MNHFLDHFCPTFATFRNLNINDPQMQAALYHYSHAMRLAMETTDVSNALWYGEVDDERLAKPEEAVRQAYRAARWPDWTADEAMAMVFLNHIPNAPKDGEMGVVLPMTRERRRKR